MKTGRILLLPLIVFLAIGCKSVQPIPENTPSIVIKTPTSGPTVMGGRVDFPAGIYAPEFQTDEGIYYLAPTKLVFGGMGIHRPKRGGLFLPFRSTSDLRHGMWLDQEEGSGGLLGAGLSSTTRLWRFEEQVRFEIQKP